MAYGLKCYCCGINEPTRKNLFYCLDCLIKLKEIFDTNGSGIRVNPKHYDHCISCGEWENRRILYTGLTEIFEYEGEGVPICEQCIKEELADVMGTSTK